MNNNRREHIASTMSILSKVKDQLDNALTRVEDVLDEETDSYESLPENLQYSDRGLNMEAAVNALETSKLSLEEAINNIDDTIGSLDEARD